MTTLRLASLLLLSCTPLAPAMAQDDFQQWLSVSAKADLAESIAIQNEIIARFSDDRGGLYEIENSFLLGYKLTKSATFWAGYVHNPQYSSSASAIMERRAREQLTIDNFAKLGGASLSARLRLEQRWRDGLDGTGWRVRPYIKLGVPLGGKSAPTFNVTTEPFINLNNTAFQTVDGLERVRTAASLSFPVSKAVKVEAGYLNQHRFVRGAADTDDHALTVSLGLTF